MTATQDRTALQLELEELKKRNEVVERVVRERLAAPSASGGKVRPLVRLFHFLTERVLPCRELKQVQHAAAQEVAEAKRASEEQRKVSEELASRCADFERTALEYQKLYEESQLEIARLRRELASVASGTPTASPQL